MNLINKQVVHKNFGKGYVVQYSDSIITINFPMGTKKFSFPDAFGTYLSLMDKKMAHSVAELKQEIEDKRRQQELKLEKERKLQQKEREQLLLRKKLFKNYRISPRSQIAFWCKEEELDTVFSEWRVFTGVVKSGASKGKPKRPARLHQNSACILTARDSDKPEESRTILGAYMVNEKFTGQLCGDGYIPAHSEYRLRLSPQESEKMFFWNYFVNEKYPQNMTWNTGRYRYFENEWMAQILRDILSLKGETQERELTQGFYNYFCRLNHIKKDNLPKPNGSLMRV